MVPSSATTRQQLLTLKPACTVLAQTNRLGRRAMRTATQGSPRTSGSNGCWPPAFQPLAAGSSGPSELRRRTPQRQSTEAQRRHRQRPQQATAATKSFKNIAHRGQRQAVLEQEKDNQIQLLTAAEAIGKQRRPVIQKALQPPFRPSLPLAPKRPNASRAPHQRRDSTARSPVARPAANGS